jgi:mannosyltransferase OCH1-like enzyme
LPFPSRIDFREAIENQNLSEVAKLLWKNVHGVVVMKIYKDGKQFSMIKNCPQISRNTKKKVPPIRLQKSQN